MDLINAIMQCLQGEQPSSRGQYHQLPLKTDLKPALSPLNATEEEEISQASTILGILFHAEKSGDALTTQLNGVLDTTNWSGSLAKRILDGLVAALEAGAAMAPVMKDAFDKSSAAAGTFVQEHPVLVAVVTTVVALGILAILVPWAVEALGFGELGPVAGSFAAWWQSTFPDVEAGSFFAFLQRLGMRLGKS